MTSELLTIEQMRNAEALAIDGGVKPSALMKAAGKAVAAEIQSRYEKQSVLVLCGSGNNGGDGFVVAQLLLKAGWPVEVACSVDVADLSGEAATAAKAWKGDVIPFDDLELPEDGIVVDALFGIGFSKSIEQGSSVASVLEAVKNSTLTVVAVDVPSGVYADSGLVDPYGLRADLTVTFYRKKFAHVMCPAAAYCGDIVVADIGIDDDIVEALDIGAIENGPDLWWRSYIRHKPKDAHKYHHGHVVVQGGKYMTGAAILAAQASMRVGAGLCTIVANPAVSSIYRLSCPSLIVEEESELARFKDHMQDPRRNVALIGPGVGVDNKGGLKKVVIDACDQGAGRMVILDADALTVFEDDPRVLLKILGPHCVVTPHEGEFARAFPDIKGTKIERALMLAKKTGAVVLIKGADTVIADKQGRCVIHTAGTGWLATAGSGDVLAGMIAGFAAQAQVLEASLFDCACMGAWFHGRAAELLGAGMMSCDLSTQVPAIFNELISG